MLKRETASLDYSYIVDGTKTIPMDAAFVEQASAAQIIKHRAKVQVEYLVEFASGERKWVVANRS